jgi:hypothetical protein
MALPFCKDERIVAPSITVVKRKMKIRGENGNKDVSAP